MEQRTMPHPGHEKHLCQLQYSGFMNQNFKKFKELVRGARFICRKCGRAAAAAESLCEPDQLHEIR